MGLDKLIHERSRLAIMAALAAGDDMTFTEVKEVTGMTDGNLSVHARVLESAGFVRVNKRFVGVKPQTTLALTAAGRAAFRKYVEQLEQVVLQTRKPKG
jgi:DNA-binding transcriptional ArsR family regulator